MKPTKRDKEILPHLTRPIVARYGIRALMNAAALIDAASLLLERGHHGASRSLSISAREECGKAFAAGSYLAGLTPEAQFAAGLRNHSYKQAEGLIGPMLAGALMRDPDLLRVILPLDTSPSEASLKQMALKMPAHADALSMALAGTLPVLQASREAASAGDHERLRQRGIYVSLEMRDGQLALEYPQEISRAEAEAELSRLRPIVSAFVSNTESGIPVDLWSDDEVAERWGNLADKVFRPGLFGSTEQVDGGDAPRADHID